MRALSRWSLIIAAVGLLAACGGKGGGAAAPASVDGDMAVGSPNAKVTVIEYASTTCSHCAKVNEEVFQPFKAKYIDSGQVRWVFREFLTAPENVAAAGFLLARCAGDDKYFEVLDGLFRGQTEMFTTGDVRGSLFKVGRGAGLSDAQITACVNDEKQLKALSDRVQKAITEHEITGTPTFLVNGKKLDGQVLAGQTYNGGEITLAQMEAAVQPLLK